MTQLVSGESRWLSPPAKDPAPRSTHMLSLDESSGRISNLFQYRDGGAPNYIPCTLERARLEAIATGLLASWQDVIGWRSDASKPLQRQVAQEGPEACTQLLRLAVNGNHALRQLVQHLGGDAGEVLMDTISDCITTSAHVPTLLMIKSKTLFPWRMLYIDPADPHRQVVTGDDPTEVDIRGFLGASVAVDLQQQNRPHPPRPGDMAAVGILPTAQDGVGGAAAVRAALRQRALQVNVTSDGEELLEHIGQDRVDLIYLLCHGQFRPFVGGIPTQELWLRPGRPITGWQIGRELSGALGDAGLSTLPIVIINACQAGVLPDRFDSIMTALAEAGAGGMAGPLVDMPTRFGEVFGIKVVHYLSSDNTLAESIRLATVGFLTDNNNPLGLAYSNINGMKATLKSARLIEGGESHG